MALSLEIITPDGVAWHSDNVDYVALPTKSGEIQVLPGHVPLITMLEAGSVEVSVQGRAENIAVDVGYARIMGDVVSILTEAAVNVEQIDVRHAEQAKENALKAIQEAKKNMLSPEEIERLEAVARFSIAQLLAKGKKKS